MVRVGKFRALQGAAEFARSVGIRRRKVVRRLGEDGRALESALRSRCPAVLRGAVQRGYHEQEHEGEEGLPARGYTLAAPTFARLQPTPEGGGSGPCIVLAAMNHVPRSTKLPRRRLRKAAIDAGGQYSHSDQVVVHSLMRMLYYKRVPALLLMLPAIATALGGLLALRLRRHLDLLIALGAGLLLGATFLDLLPEALNLGAGLGWTNANLLGLTLLFFLLFFAADYLVSVMEAGLARRSQDAQWLRRVSASLLVFHSFRDGMAIGAAYAASRGAGYAVALGIAAHDLGDGMNTVLLTTRGERPQRGDYGWLAADALAPVLGGLLTFWWFVSSRDSVILLLLAVGFFLQIATGDFLPHVRRCGKRRSMLVSVGVGALFIYVANLLLGRGRL